MSQPELDLNGTTFTITETKHGKRLDIHGEDYYDLLWDDDMPDLIKFLTTHFGAPRD